MENHIKQQEFVKVLPIIKSNIGKRKYSWNIPSLEWEDVSQILILRVWTKFDKYSTAKGTFEHWLNKLITNALNNLIRDNFSKYSRPCIAGCVYNLGNDDCSFTQSRKQCSECPLYKKWTVKKQQQFNMITSLSLEDHSNETYNIESDGASVDFSKQVIDDRLKESLSIRDYKIYKMMFIDHKSLEYIGKKMNFKLLPSSHIPGYQELLKLKRKFINLSREIIIDEGLA